MTQLNVVPSKLQEDGACDGVGADPLVLHLLGSGLRFRVQRLSFGDWVHSWVPGVERREGKRGYRRVMMAVITTETATAISHNKNDNSNTGHNNNETGDTANDKT